MITQRVLTQTRKVKGFLPFSFSFIERRSMDKYDVWLEYEQWLCQLVNPKKKDVNNGILCLLHDMEFTWDIERDRNRAADGINLRKRFHAERGKFLGVNDRHCTVLEMLIALSIRVETEFIGDPRNPHPEKFFWEMIDNLGIVPIRSGNGVFKNKMIIQRWLQRDFGVSGCGSPFPLQHAKRDQRNIEIWDQMNAYLFENY